MILKVGSETQSFQAVWQEEPRTPLGHAFRSIIRMLTAPLRALGKLVHSVVISRFKNFYFPSLATKKSTQPMLLSHYEDLQKSLGGIPVDLKTSDGISLKAMYFSRSNVPGPELAERHPKVYSKDPQNTVILCIGSDASVFSRDYESTIKSYLARGLNVMAFDYREIGLSGGSITAKGMDLDAEAAFQYVRDFQKVPKEKIFIEGYSMGSGPATHLAAHHPGVSLLLRCPFVKPAEAGGEMLTNIFLRQKNLPKWLVKIIVRIGVSIAHFALPFDNTHTIKKVQGRVGIITAQHDQNVFEDKLHNAERIQQAFVRANKTQKDFMLSYRGLALHHMSQYAQEDKLSSALDDYLLAIGFASKSILAKKSLLK